MIPFLHPKIWYAFQGLPIERVGECDRLPYSNCAVLTNNLMYILKFEFLTEYFGRIIDKAAAISRNGVTFCEYMEFINTYLKEVKHKSNEIEEHSERNSNPLNLSQYENTDNKTRLRGNTIDKLNIGKLNENASKSDLQSIIEQFNDYTWTLYKSRNISNLVNQSILKEDFHNLWLLFITYAIKTDDKNTTKIPVVMDLLEAQYWCNRTLELLGCRKVFQDVDIKEEISEIDFVKFLEMVQELFKITNLNESLIKIGLAAVAEEALNGITAKGSIRVDRSTRYCILQSFTIMIYNNKTTASNFRSSFVIQPDTELLIGTNKIQLKSQSSITSSSLILEINDIQQFNKWCTALTDAIQFAKLNIKNPPLYEAECREKFRETKRLNIKMRRLSVEFKIKEERDRRYQLEERMKKQLNEADEELKNFRQKMQEEIMAKEELLKESEFIKQETDIKIKQVLHEQEAFYQAQVEKLQKIETEKTILNFQLQASKEEKSLEEKKREFLEAKHSETQEMLYKAEEQILLLKELREKLEKALEEERQAKKDEEIVRNAAIELLEEEQNSKLVLEQLLEQQKNTLNSEILKNNQIMEALETQKIRMKEIGEEKEKMTKLLEDSQKRMQTTGIRVRNLDSKVAKIAESTFRQIDSKIPVSHRGRGFLAEIITQTNLNRKVPFPTDDSNDSFHDNQKTEKTDENN